MTWRRALRNLGMTVLTLLLLYPFLLIVHYIFIDYIAFSWYWEMTMKIPRTEDSITLLLRYAIPIYLGAGGVGFLGAMLLDAWGEHKLYSTGILTAVAAFGLSFALYYGTVRLWAPLLPLCLYYTFVAVTAMLAANRTDAQLTDMRRLLLGIALHLGVFLLCLLFPEFKAGSQSILEPAALVYFVLSVFVMNGSAVRHSAVARKEDGAARVPRSIKHNNLILTMIFLVVVAFVASFESIGKFFVKVFADTVVLVRDGYQAFLALFAEPDAQETARATAAADPTPTAGALNQYERMGSSFFTYELSVFLIIFAAVLLSVFLLIKFWPAIRKGLKFLRDWILSWHAAGGDEGDYTDDEEDLIDRSARKPLGDRLRARIIEIVAPKERFSDMPDARARVRFAYRQILRRALERDASAIGRTPTEQLAQMPPNKDVSPEQYDAFAVQYNRARYSEHEIGEDASELARLVVKKGL